jgi:hypothetical protein
MCLQVLYTGDFSREEDRHLVAAEVPPVKPHILITVLCFGCFVLRSLRQESTYGIHKHDDREQREKRFTGWLGCVLSGTVLMLWCRHHPPDCEPRRPMSDSGVCPGAHARAHAHPRCVALSCHHVCCASLALTPHQTSTGWHTPSCTRCPSTTPRRWLQSAWPCTR